MVGRFKKQQETSNKLTYKLPALIKLFMKTSENNIQIVTFGRLILKEIDKMGIGTSLRKQRQIFILLNSWRQREVKVIREVQGDAMTLA